MQKSSIEKLLKSQGHYAGDLVSLQFKSQSLQQFLENVVQIVNQHSRRINTLQIDKISKEQISKTHLDFANAAKVNPTVVKQLNVTIQDRINSSDQNSTEVCSNLVNHSKALLTLFQTTKKMNQRIQNLSGVLDSFQNKDNVKQSIRKTTNTAKKYTEDQCEKILTRLKELQMKTNKKISEFENTTKEVQKKTLWKINECQTALLKKITPEYVERAFQQFQSKILNDISNNKNQQLNELKFNSDTLKAKLQMLSRNVQDYERQNKLLIKELTQDAKKFESKDKIQHDKRDQDMRMKQLLIKIDRLERRQDPQQLEIRILKSIDEHKEKIEATTEKLKKMENDVSSLNSVLSTIGGTDGSGIDPHKLCHMDGQIRRLRDSNRTNELKVQSLEDELKLKLITFEERIMTTLGLLKGQDNFVSREEMYQSLARLRQPVMQKLGENQNLIYEVNGKLSKLEMFEKVTKRKIKEMTRGDDLNKILDMKMNIGQAEAQFNSVKMKMENLQIILNKIRMEVDSSSEFLRILQQQMSEPEEGINIIGPRQKVFPAKCLGCGQKHIPNVHENNMMQGSDGKYYKVDLKNSYLYDQKEVYGVTPSQIAVYESGVKKRITSATNRPTSSRTNLRPSSAKHF